MNHECPAEIRSELLQQLAAFNLRHPGGLLVTSTVAEGLQDILGAAVLRSRSPDQAARLAILDIHGAKDVTTISAQLTTPYELSIAAECASSLREYASATELQAAYVRHFAPSEHLRAGLRALAIGLHSEMRTSMSLLDAGLLLDQRIWSITPQDVDDVLGCALLAVDGHRIRFRHELVGQFLAAEHLVRSAASGPQLGSLLADPQNALLATTALSIEADAQRSWDAAKAIADPRLVSAALSGAFGPKVAHLAHEAIRDVLRLSIATTDASHAAFEGADAFTARWVSARSWSRTEQALLASAGHALGEGVFIDDICDLLDRTDELCAGQVSRLAMAGLKDPVGAVVAATVTQLAPRDDRGLPASFVAVAFELAQSLRSGSPDLAVRLRGSGGRRSWSRLYMTVLATCPDDPQDQERFASLLQEAWAAGGYHLRLEAIQKAASFCGADEPHREAVLASIRSLETANVLLRSCVVEALAGFGDIDSGITVDQLLAEIRGILTTSDDVDGRTLAGGITSAVFEDDAIVGPYWEAIEELEPGEKARLFTMAVHGLHATESMFVDWTVHRLGELIPTGDAAIDEAAKEAFRKVLTDPPLASVFRQNATAAWLGALRGWAALERDLHHAPTGAIDPERRNWQIMAQLLIRYERTDTSTDTEAWRSLRDAPAAAIGVLAALDSARAMSYEPQCFWIDRLIDDFRPMLRELFEWALDNQVLRI